MKLGRYETVDDGGNYVMFHDFNVCIKFKCHVSRAERSIIIPHNELRPPLPHIALILKQVNFKAQLYDLKNRLVLLKCLI